MSYAHVGKTIRLKRILKDGKAVIFAFDHGVEHGPSGFPEMYVNPRKILSKVVDVVDGVMMLPGMAAPVGDIWGNKTSLIVKVTSKTILRPEDTRHLQSPFGTVEEAISLGTDAVAATVYWGSEFEDHMLRLWVDVKFTKDSEFHIPVYHPEKVVDTTGAGDAFVAGLLTALRKGYEIKDAVRYAVIVAGIKVSRLGSHEIPTEEEVEDIIAKLKE